MFRSRDHILILKWQQQKFSENSWNNRIDLQQIYSVCLLGLILCLHSIALSHSSKEYRFWMGECYGNNWKHIRTLYDPLFHQIGNQFLGPSWSYWSYWPYCHFWLEGNHWETSIWLNLRGKDFQSCFKHHHYKWLIYNMSIEYKHKNIEIHLKLGIPAAPSNNYKSLSFLLYVIRNLDYSLCLWGCFT